MKYIVMEIQKFADGAMTTPCYAYDDLRAAESKYYTILASAVMSAVTVHACALLTEEGVTLKSECYRHESAEAV